MNALVIGKNKSPILDFVPNDNFLVVDDGPFIDQVKLIRRHVRQFDPTKHRFNPLSDIDEDKARAVADIVYAAFPQGQNTLTVRNGKRALAPLVLNAQRLDRLERGEEDDVLEANAVIDDLLFSPRLRKMFCKPPNFSLTGTIVAKLDRSKIPALDCFIIANFLIAEFPGTIIIPDFGFYGCKLHTSLIDQERLIAGINYLDETPLKNDLLLIKDKVGSGCLYKDAVVLAEFAGLRPDPDHAENDYDQSIRRSMTL